MSAAARRKRMVDSQLRARGIADPRVLEAMSELPREMFVPADLAGEAYADGPLPIAAGQSISQPYVVALMIEALELGDDEDVLEIGTGSGYAAAVLSRIARCVFTIERHAELVDAARARLARLGCANVAVRWGDGTHGWPERAPFTAIVVAAGTAELPHALIEQLAIGGRLVIPLGGAVTQELVRITRIGPARFRREMFGTVEFVPLVAELEHTDSAHS